MLAADKKGRVHEKGVAHGRGIVLGQHGLQSRNPLIRPAGAERPVAVEQKNPVAARNDRESQRRGPSVIDSELSEHRVHLIGRNAEEIHPNSELVDAEACAWRPATGSRRVKRFAVARVVRPAARTASRLRRTRLCVAVGDAEIGQLPLRFDAAAPPSASLCQMRSAVGVQSVENLPRLAKQDRAFTDTKMVNGRRRNEARLIPRKIRRVISPDQIESHTPESVSDPSALMHRTGGPY